MKTFFYPIFPSDFMKFRLLLVLLLLPLFWIGISNSHDWGDDYAQYLLQSKNLTENRPQSTSFDRHKAKSRQYLLQSKNLIENRPQTNSDLVFAEGQLPYAIIAYPVGFPALLAPVYSTFKLFIPPYLYLQTLILILSAVLLFDYLKRSFDIKLSLLIAIFYAYNIISSDCFITWIQRQKRLFICRNFKWFSDVISGVGTGHITGCFWMDFIYAKGDSDSKKAAEFWRFFISGNCSFHNLKLHFI